MKDSTMAIHLSIHLAISLSVVSVSYLSTYLSICLHTYLSDYISIDLLLFWVFFSVCGEISLILCHLFLYLLLYLPKSTHTHPTIEFWSHDTPEFRAFVALFARLCWSSSCPCLSRGRFFMYTVGEHFLPVVQGRSSFEI